MSKVFKLILASGFCWTAMATAALADPFDYGTPGIVSPLNLDAGQSAFNFDHRWGLATFPLAAEPAFTIRVGLGDGFEINTILSTAQSNGIYEGEFGLRWQVLNEYNRDWLSMTPYVGYDTLGNTLLGELTASKKIWGPLGLAMVGRVFSNSGSLGQSPGIADGIGAGAEWELTPGLSLMGDFFINSGSGYLPDYTEIQSQRAPFNVGIQWYIPDTPHVLMLTFGSSGRQSTMGRSYTDSIGDFQIGFEYGSQFATPFWHQDETPDDEE